MLHARATCVLCLLLVSAASSVRGQSTATSTSLEFSQQISRTIVLTTQSPVASGSFVIDDCQHAYLRFGSASKTLTVVLDGPAGQHVIIGEPDTSIAQSQILTNVVDPNGPGAAYYAVLLSPQIGAWSYLITESQVLTAPRVVVFDCDIDGGPGTAMTTGQAIVNAGEPVDLCIVTIEGGATNTGITSDVELLRKGDPEFVAPTIAFHDDGVGRDGQAGDGLYTASVTALGLSGLYLAVATVHGLNSLGNPFERTAAVQFRILESKAQFGSGLTDRGVDVNGDGFFEYLVISPNVVVTVSGRYSVELTVVASNDNSMKIVALSALTSSSTSFDVFLDARTIRESLGVDGPYEVASAKLICEDPPVRALVDSVAPLGATSPFLLSQLQHEGIEILVGGAIDVIDTNANGKFELLQASFGIGVVVEGDYLIAADLVSPGGVLVATIPVEFGTRSFEMTDTSLTLTFSGHTIGGVGIDGPYKIRNVRLLGTGGATYVPELMMTNALRASEFEGYCTLTPPEDIAVGTGVSAQCGAVVEFAEPGTTANCGSVTCVPASGSYFEVGTTTVICTTSTGFSSSFAVSVADTTAPSVTCPSSSGVSVTGSCETPIPNVLGAVTVSDNCNSAASIVLTQTPVAGTLVGPGMHPIIVSATDAASNTGTCTTAFTVVDAQPPIITGPVPAIYLRTSTSAGGAVITFPSPSASDNCGTVNVTAIPASGATFPNGKTLVSATAVDAAGLSASTQFTVKVVRFGESIGIYIPSTAGWFLRNTNSNGGADLTFSFGPGGDGWVPIAGDWDRSGTDTPGLFYNKTAGVFLSDTNGPGGANYVFTYGPSGSGWIPIAGDWNGEGLDSIGLYDPSTGNFFLKNINAAGNADVILQLGPGDAGFLPIVGDWNGDGVDTVGIYNPETGVFFLRNSNTNGPADVTFTFGAGGRGYLPVSGDWDGDTVCTIGLYDPSAGAFLLRNSNDDGPADIELTFGPSDQGAVPVAGSWDGQ